MNTAFETWFANELGNGLADIKFAVVPGRGISVQAIQDDVLTAEAALAAGYTKPLPKATSMLPEAIATFIAAH